jgi:tetratricopeptide (TPR) repeat protein
MATLNVRHLLYAAVAIFALGQISGCGKNDAPGLVASAKSYMAKSDYKAASIQLKSALQEAPDNAEARFLLASSLLETGDASAAETEVRKALELKYSPDDAYPLLARTLLAQGNYDKVISNLRDRKLESAQARAELGTSVATAQLALGDPKSARASIDAALAGLPPDARALTIEAEIAAASNDLPGASKLIDAALALAPKDSDALLVKSQLEVAAGHPDQAVATLESAVEGDAKTLNARATLVALLVTSGKLDKAAAQVAIMKKLAPQQFGTLYSDALVSFARGDAAHARDVIQTVLAVKSDHLPSLLLSGLANYQLGSYAAAEEALSKVVAQAPNAAGARRTLAMTYLRMGRANQAIETIQPALQRAPDDAQLLRLAGEAYIASGNMAKASEYYGRASAIDKGDATSKVRLAQVRYATGDTARALSDLESLSAADSSDSQADVALITAHLRRREFDQALAAVAALEKKQPANPLTYNIKGIVFVSKQDYKSARASFDKALELQPSFFGAARNLGLLDVQQGKPDAAKKRYEQMLAKDPKNEQVLLALAELLSYTGHGPAEVKAALDRAIAAAPTSIAPRMALVGYYSSQRDAKAALTAAQSAQAAFPNDAQVIAALGAAQLSAGESNEAQVVVKDYNAAIETLRKIIAIQPDQPQGWIAIAKTYVLSGHPESAVAEARKVQKEHPDRALGFALEAEVLAAQKKWTEAEVAYKEASVRQPLPVLAIARYNALQNAGKSAEAAGVAENWIKENPKDATFQGYLGDQSLVRKDYRAAVPHLQAALGNEPDDPRLLNNLAYALTELGDPKAGEIAERAYVQAPFNPDVIDTLGWALVQTSDVNRGIELLRAASSLAPANQEIRLHLAKALIKSGDKTSARRELETLAKVDPSSPLRADAEKLLSGL